jgi:hypothetical protein
MHGKSETPSSSVTTKKRVQDLLKMLGFVAGTFIMFASILSVSGTHSDRMRDILEARIDRVPHPFSQDSLAPTDSLKSMGKQPNDPIVSHASSTVTDSHPALKGTFLIVIMLLGIVCGHLHSILSTVSKEGDDVTLTLVRQSFAKASLWKSVLASPILFSVVYINCQTQPDLILAGFFAFQNGFLCNVVLDKQIASVNLPANPSSSQVA